MGGSGGHGGYGGLGVSGGYWFGGPDGRPWFHELPILVAVTIDLSTFELSIEDFEVDEL
ncbi:hypothetical protein [Anaerocolumna sedimenticola]|uniref:hypothetical protein n=1 Tax=Anaerocolumna sedimenticola TaxID=2696063 RepID=UPI001FE41C50|nr:hypothetical protein [Anaerocolumna sedimenticola]